MSIQDLVERRISQAENILVKLSHLKLDGITKLRNKMKQEIKFLEKCLNTNKLKEEHLMCSNLTHLEAVAAQVLKHKNDCTSVMNNKTLKNEGMTERKICIDLVLNGGSVWMKVVARNRKALTLISNGDCSFGQRSILDQAVEFIECSNQNIYYFKPPSVIFYFANGIENCLAKDLSDIGISVETNDENFFNKENLLLSDEEDDDVETELCDIKLIQNIKLINSMENAKLNLGVTTLIAYVSNLTNGGSHHIFESDILRKHAQWERARPVKPILDKLFEGKELYCCRTAVKDFQSILNTVGGKQERERGRELLERVIIVEDHPTERLRPGGKIKARSLVIFGTGEYLKAITVTANHAFVRSAMNRGIFFEVYLHESRALTEGKERPL